MRVWITFHSYGKNPPTLSAEIPAPQGRPCAPAELLHGKSHCSARIRRLLPAAARQPPARRALRPPHPRAHRADGRRSAATFRRVPAADHHPPAPGRLLLYRLETTKQPTLPHKYTINGVPHIIYRHMIINIHGNSYRRMT